MQRGFYYGKFGCYDRRVIEVVRVEGDKCFGFFYETFEDLFANRKEDEVCRRIDYVVTTGVYFESKAEIQLYIIKTPKDVTSSLDRVRELSLHSEAFAAIGESGEIFNKASDLPVLVKRESDIETKRSTAQKIMACYSSYMQTESKKLAAIKKEMDAKMIIMYDAISFIQRKITTIKMYCGENVNITQVCTGKRGTGKFVMQQMCMYMDEEVGDPWEGGIDIDSVDKFYDWLGQYVIDIKTGQPSKTKNHERILRERSIVSFKIRRFRKDYGDRTLSAEMEYENRRTALVIRDGGNVWVIWTELNFTQLFPNVDILEKMDSFVKEEGLRYEQLFIFLQGLIDNSDIFEDKFSLFDMVGRDEFFTFEYQLNAITTGVKFRDILNDMIQDVKVGDRIYLPTQYAYDPNYTRKASWRYPENYIYKCEYMKPPKSGVYTIEDMDKTGARKTLTIMFLPEDGYRERKNRLSYKLSFNDIFMPYDKFNIDIMYDAMYDRDVRRAYKDYMGMLWDVYKHLRDDMRDERALAEMVVTKTGCDIDRVMQLIVDWKNAHKWKVGVTQKDHLYRLFTNKIIKQNKQDESNF